VTDEQYAEDLRVMIAADREHLSKHMEQGDTHIAHGFVDSIIANTRELKRMEKRIERCAAAGQETK
jgi:acetyl-CoA carboxylase beta subunit